MHIKVDNKMKVELGSENESENGIEIKHPIGNLNLVIDINTKVKRT